METPSCNSWRPVPWLAASLVLISCLEDPTQPRSPDSPAVEPALTTTVGRTRLTIDGSRFRINGALPYAGHPAEGKLMNVRMVNSVFEDTRRTWFNPSENTDELVYRMRDYVSLGVRAFSVSLQGGFPGYEGAINTAFHRDGSLKSGYLARVARVIGRADALGAVVILGLYYQRQDQFLRDDAAVREGVIRVADWIKRNGFTNVILEIANEYGHSGFDHPILRSDAGVASLIRLAQQRNPALRVGASSIRNGRTTAQVGAASDLIITHLNAISLSDISSRIRALREAYPHKPIVCNEDVRTGSAAAKAATISVGSGASYGLMLKWNQSYPFYFTGRQDDPIAYDRFLALATR
jgi:hypothetical protein